MSCAAFNCKTIIERLSKRSLFYSRRYIYLKSGLKIAVAVVATVPTTSTQSELKNSSDINNDTSDGDGEKHELYDKAGWERVKAMYQKDDYGSYSRELTATWQTTCLASLIGFVYGGFKSSRIALNDFIERNQATMFENHLDAKRRLQNHVSIHFGKGAFYWGIRLAAYNAGIMMFLTTMLAYRGHSSVVDYMLGGCISGALLRFRLGPRAAVAGGTLGLVLGSICGLTTQGMFYLTGTSLDDVISYQYEFDQNRYRLFKENQDISTEKDLSGEALNLLKSHDARFIKADDKKSP